MPSKRLTERITINCTAEQKRAFKAARNEAGDGLSDNQALHALLAEYCASQGIAWPEGGGKWGDENRIGRMRNRKKNEGENA